MYAFTSVLPSKSGEKLSFRDKKAKEWVKTASNSLVYSGKKRMVVYKA